MSLIIFSATGWLSAIVLFTTVGIETKTKPINFSATASDTGETVLIGTTNLGLWFKAVTVSTDDDLGYDQVEIWLAEEEVTVTKTSHESESVTNSAGFVNLYTYQNSNFRFEFYNVTGPPGYSVTLNIYESNSVTNQVCTRTFGDIDVEYLVYSCAINQTGYYNIQYVVSNNVSGTVKEELEIVKLNYTFYNSISVSCILDNSNRTCTLLDPTPKLTLHGKQYIVVFIPSWLAPTFQILPKGRVELYSAGAILFFLVSLVFFTTLPVCCYCYCKIKRTIVLPQ